MKSLLRIIMFLVIVIGLSIWFYFGRSVPVYDFYNPQSKIISNNQKIQFYITPEYGYFKAASPYELDIVFTSYVRNDIFLANKIYLSPLFNVNAPDIILYEGGSMSLQASKVAYKPKMHEYDSVPDKFMNTVTFTGIELEHKEYALVIETPDGDLISLKLRPFTRKVFNTIR